jgi:hypothetical protein
MKMSASSVFPKEGIRMEGLELHLFEAMLPKTVENDGG